MSKLGGHWKLTKTAVSEIHAACSDHPLGRYLQAAEFPRYVISRDLLDVLSLGHWGDFGQPHHFMRRFDGQSPRGAYEESVEWVHFNALNAANIMAKRIKRYIGLKKNPGLSPRVTTRKTCNLPFGRISSSQLNLFGGYEVLSPRFGADWQTLGNALHAVQDSFSAGHVLRESYGDSKKPGPILHVKSYGGAEKHMHSEYDEKWEAVATGKYSPAGRFAIDATKMLLELVIETAVRVPEPVVLYGWEGFKKQWLSASEQLSDTRDFAIDFVVRFYRGLTFGATNIKTVLMDEEGMVKALLSETLMRTQQVSDVFSLLEKEFSSDADDVAALYVKGIMTRKGAFSERLAKDGALKALLIRIINSGWISNEEKKYVAYLQSL